MLSFIAETLPGGQRIVFHLAGVIDDNADLDLAPQAVAAEVVLDLDGITGMNSYGVRKLADALRSLAGKKLAYSNCRVLMVQQFNMISSLVHNVEILSFYMPFECQSCAEEFERLVETSKVNDDEFLSSLNQREVCPRCDRHMSFLEDETIYFRFLKRKRP